MKKIDLYQCEICGTQFKSKEDLPYTQDGSGMPTTITLVGPDGRHYTYKR